MRRHFQQIRVNMVLRREILTQSTLSHHAYTLAGAPGSNLTSSTHAANVCLISGRNHPTAEQFLTTVGIGSLNISGSVTVAVTIYRAVPTIPNAEDILRERTLLVTQDTGVCRDSLIRSHFNL